MTWPTTTRTPDISVDVAGARPRWTAATDVHRGSVP